MRPFRILIAVGGILLIVGIYLVIPANSVSGNQTANIPPGAAYYYHIGFNVVKGGRISGTFSNINLTSLQLFIFNDQQYSTYQSGGSPDNMFTTTGASGSFSASIQTPGNYYLILQHTASMTNSGLIVQVSWLIDGSNITLLGAGLAVLAAAVAMIIVGYRKMGKSQPAPAAADVIRFDQPKPSNPPSSVS